MVEEMLAAARGGDREAFAALVEPHRREVLVHCYRMLGSLQDAEDALQESLLAAWVGLAGFEGRSSVRTWLYRIATNRCLNALRAASRRPVAADPPAGLPAEVPEPSGRDGVTWLQPYPDAMLPDPRPGPEARYEAAEAVSLAFVTAVQVLPPQQRAVLLLRDVLGYRAAETADLLGTTEDAVTSALKRARAAVDAARRGGPPAPPPAGRRERAAADRFAAALTGGDIAELLALLTDDVRVRMPPLPFEYRGREAAGAFLVAVQEHRHSIARMEPTRANGRPAWGEYVPDPVSGALHLVGVLAIDLSGDLVHEIVHFEAGTGSLLGLPRTLE